MTNFLSSIDLSPSRLSKRFIVAAVSIAALYLHTEFGVTLEPETQTLIAAIAIAAISGYSLEDIMKAWTSGGLAQLVEGATVTTMPAVTDGERPLQVQVQMVDANG